MFQISYKIAVLSVIKTNALDYVLLNFDLQLNTKLMTHRRQCAQTLAYEQPFLLMISALFLSQPHRRVCIAQ